MIELRPFAGLGRFDADWLKARYHFSFSEYHDPARMGVGMLRVWNDDTIQPGTGFPPHPHRDMEIITYVREGAITHEDHLGNRGRTEAGDVQVMSAGSGIVHAEYNLEAEPALIYQIWIRTDARGHTPRWANRQFPKGERAGQLVALASGRPEDKDSGALHINQNAAVLGATVKAGQTIVHTMAPGRCGYLAVAKGAVTLNGQPMGLRDGAAIAGESALTITAVEDAEILLVDTVA